MKTKIAAFSGTVEQFKRYLKEERKKPCWWGPKQGLKQNNLFKL